MPHLVIDIVACVLVVRLVLLARRQRPNFRHPQQADAAGVFFGMLAVHQVLRTFAASAYFGHNSEPNYMVDLFSNLAWGGAIGALWVWAEIGLPGTVPDRWLALHETYRTGNAPEGEKPRNGSAAPTHSPRVSDDSGEEVRV